MSLRDPSSHPYRTLLLTFLLARTAYFLIALLTPSPSYDSSTSLILPSRDGQGGGGGGGVWWRLLTALSERLTRWDAIYFVKIAERGYANEQEWAFGYGMTALMRVVGKLIIRLCPVDLPYPYPFVFSGILIANLSHLLSAFALYRLTQLLYPTSAGQPFVAAVLHILSPAGLFLASPYGESLFSLLSFLGYYFYVKSAHTYHAGNRFGQLVAVAASGVVFLLAATVRSNGVLNGLIFLSEFLREGCAIVRCGEGSTGDGLAVGDRVARLVGLGIAGIMVGMGVAIPQIIAWLDYCTIKGETREWCTRTIPSIYLFVQDHYWNVGFLRYWTLSNIPLFLLAAPMLYLLIHSGLSVFTSTRTESTDPPSKTSVQKAKLTSAPPNTLTSLNNSLICTLALPQVTLAVLALTSYHVQIINRLSSGYVVWYWWLARIILFEEDGGGTRKIGRWAVKWCVGYGFVHAVLFAGFLPPA